MTLTDDEFDYILSSKRRMDVLFVLSEIDATIEEIAAATGGNMSYLGIVARDLKKRGFVDYKSRRIGRMFFLTNKGEEAFKRMSEYLGVER